MSTILRHRMELDGAGAREWPTTWTPWCPRRISEGASHLMICGLVVFATGLALQIMPPNEAASKAERRARMEALQAARQATDIQQVTRCVPPDSAVVYYYRKGSFRNGKFVWDSAYHWREECPIGGGSGHRRRSHVTGQRRRFFRNTRAAAVLLGMRPCGRCRRLQWAAIYHADPYIEE